MVTDFKKKQKAFSSKNIFFLIFIIFLFLLIFTMLVIANLRIMNKKKELALQMSNLQNQIADIEKSNANLKKGIAQATDANYMEKVAREELDMQKPGEKVVSFIAPKTKPLQIEEQNISKKWFSWLSNSWQWLKNKF